MSPVCSTEGWCLLYSFSVLYFHLGFIHSLDFNSFIPDQSMESSLRVKMKSPDTVWDVSIKLMDHGDHQDLGKFNVPCFILLCFSLPTE